jgi:hypothetical protein
VKSFIHGLNFGTVTFRLGMIDNRFLLLSMPATDNNFMIPFNCNSEMLLLWWNMVFGPVARFNSEQSIPKILLFEANLTSNFQLSMTSVIIQIYIMELSSNSTEYNGSGLPLT